MAKNKPKTNKHPWRKCPLGHHWRSSSHVDAHTRRSFNVKERYRKGTCVKNHSGKDTLYDDEIHLISNSFFSKMKSKISENKLGYKRGNEFNQLIDGWVKYWNDILKPKVPLDPDFVKALIATESSFNPKAKNYAGKRSGYARGLMQVTELTVKYLAGHRKELRNHLLHIEQDDLFDPNINISAGVRWLFRKKQIADAKFKGASWLETVMLYKGRRSMNHKEVKEFIRLYERIKNEKL